VDNDVIPVGQVLGRREMLARFGASGLVLATGVTWAQRPMRPDPMPDCVVRPEQTEGPYFVDERLLRADIRADPATGEVSAGAPLALSFVVSRVERGACEPLPGAVVDVWHCDGNGVYSDVTDRSFDTRSHKFLRGYQVTDKAGQVTFRTVYPGWYPGRAVHIHFKVRTAEGAVRASEFTSQVYFDDLLTDQVHAGEPYVTKVGQRQRNAADRIFQSGGEQLLLPVTPVAGGYQGTFALGLQLS
jgi:protocatechuate 3,4-dioxygenase beta subunit